MTEHEGKVVDVRAGENLADRKALEQLLVGDPALLLDQHPPYPEEDAAKPRQADTREGDEDLARVARRRNTADGHRPMIFDPGTTLGSLWTAAPGTLSHPSVPIPC